MKPSLGPIKGGTQITLSGSGFIPNVPTTVRFSCLPPICEGNGAQVDVPGTVTSWNTMTAIVPELNVAIDWTVQVTFNGDFFVKMNNTFKTIGMLGFELCTFGDVPYMYPLHIDIACALPIPTMMVCDPPASCCSTSC